MFGSGANAYRKVGIESEVLSADPHRLILMLFDGALQAIVCGRALLVSGKRLNTQEIALKCAHLGKAIRIVDEGLRVSVDPSHDPAFAKRIVSLYQYVVMRLLQANLRSDVKSLDEAAKILGDLRAAWAQIGPQVSAAAAPGLEAAGAPAAPGAISATVVSPARRALSAYQI